MTGERRNPSEIVARDYVRECAGIVRMSAELVERAAMTASMPVLEQLLRAMRSATTEAINAYKQAAPAAEPDPKPQKATANG